MGLKIETQIRLRENLNSSAEFIHPLFQPVELDSLPNFIFYLGAMQHLDEEHNNTILKKPYS
jgi:hypothetical protein